MFLPEGIADTAVLRGKLLITEQDLRTFAERSENFDSLYARHFGITRNSQEFEAVTWRDLATALTGGYQNYYCDHNDDYFADPAMHAVIRRQNQVLRASVDWPHATVPGIAVILDDRAVLATSGSGHVLHEAALWEFRTGVSRSGVPFRIYQVEDLALENFPEHRVFYFPSLYEATERQKALIARCVLCDGNVVVWGPGSGIRQDAAIGPGSAQALTGFDFFFEAVNYPRRVQITDFDHPITRGLASDLVFGSSVAYGPMLYPISGRRLGLAYSRRGGDHSGLAVATFGRGARSEAADGSLGAGDYAAVFTTAAPLPADLWRGIARYAGAHVYTEENDVLLASEGLVALHTLKSGPRTLRLPGPHRVTDLITGERLGEATDALPLDLQAPATVFFRLERAQAK